MLTTCLPCGCGRLCVPWHTVRQSKTTSERFELSRSKSNGLAIHRLNHSATMSWYAHVRTNYKLWYHKYKDINHTHIIPYFVSLAFKQLPHDILYWTHYYIIRLLYTTIFTTIPLSTFSNAAGISSSLQYFLYLHQLYRIFQYTSYKVENT